MNSSDKALISNALPISIDFPIETPALVEAITNTYKRISNAVNGKESALYSLQEQSTFQLYFISTNPQIFRNVYRKCFDMVSLNGAVIPAGGTVSFPHNIVGLQESALIFVNATNTLFQRFSFMYPNVILDATNVTVINPDGANNLTQCDVVANYLKVI